MAEIWIADDDADDLFFMQEALLDMGIGIVDIRSFSSGQTVLEKLLRLYQGGQPLPDILFIDGRMPGMDGTEVIKALHARGLTAKLRVILLSDSINTRQETIARACRAASYRKPPTPADLLVLLHEIMNVSLDEFCLKTAQKNSPPES